MRNIVNASRRDILCAYGLGAPAVGMFRANPGYAQKITLAPAILTAGGVAVRKIDIPPAVMATPAVAPDGQPPRCKLESGSMRFRAEFVLDAVPGFKPAWFGQVVLLQNVNFKHRRLAAKTGLRQCAGSNGMWQLDGKDPYLNHVVPCHAGLNAIDLADEPGVSTEDSTTPYETVEVLPDDEFRTYVIWETTDDNRHPSPTNPKKTALPRAR